MPCEISIEHFPFTGGEVYSLGGGPEYDSFPIERNVSFFLNMTQGMVFQYILELDNGTFLTNSSTSPVNYIFPEVNCGCAGKRIRELNDVEEVGFSLFGCIARTLFMHACKDNILCCIL